MANYKTANQLPILEEVTKTTFALVEDGGSLKRVSGENLGGKSNCCVISIEMGSQPSGVESTDSYGNTYTCNMTYAELMENLQNKTLTSFNINLYSGTEMRIGSINNIYFGSSAPGIMIQYTVNETTNMLQFSADDTISTYQEDS